MDHLQYRQNISVNTNVSTSIKRKYKLYQENVNVRKPDISKSRSKTIKFVKCMKKHHKVQKNLQHSIAIAHLHRWTIRTCEAWTMSHA